MVSLYVWKGKEEGKGMRMRGKRGKDGKGIRKGNERGKGKGND